LSWSTHVMVLLTPITMFATAGQKLFPEPAPCGMIISPGVLDGVHVAELEVVDFVELEGVLDVVVEVVVVVVVEVVVEGVVVEDVELGAKM